jgi:cell division protein FtsZ
MAESEGVAVVKVIGVGGGGGNAINTMVANRLQGVEFIAANTDKQALMQSQADICLQLGPSVTKGLGAGATPETGEQAALESLEDIKEALRGSDLVFVTAGLGGGTGTGAAPVVAKVSKELGALTVAVVTRPFSFEGKFRTRNAEAGWEELQKYADTIITVPNDRLLSLMQKNSKLSDMLTMADNVLLQAVKGITDLINVPGLINADFADLRTVMREVGPAIMGSGSAVGENRAVEAARKAIDNQLLEDFGIDGARGLLINISASEKTFAMSEFMEASALIQERVDEDAKVVIGALYDDSLDDELHVTVIATGVGNAAGKKEAIAQVNDLHRKKQDREREVQREPESYGSSSDKQAPVNRHPRVTRLPGSNFETLDHFSAGAGESDRRRDMPAWHEDQLETPAYLRKKAN